MSTPCDLPKGLPRYEFIRDLYRDAELPTLHHFTTRLHPQTEKPLLTPSGEPDKRPLSWSVFFNREPEHVEIEIGSGKGGFLVEYAQKYPERYVLGSEWDAGCARYAAERLHKRGLCHCAVLRGDIFYFLRDRLPDQCVDAVHMYFPDPWPKKRQQKNRLLRPDFLREIARVLKPGKRFFYWATDHAEYNALALELFAQTPGTRIVIRDTAPPTEQIMTSFEIKYRKEGRPIYRSIIEFSK